MTLPRWKLSGEKCPKGHEDMYMTRLSSGRLLRRCRACSVLTNAARDKKRREQTTRRTTRLTYMDRREIPPGHEGSLSWDELPWSEDDWCWYVTEVHPDGITLEQIGMLMGLTRERVRQIEVAALEKLGLDAFTIRKKKEIVEALRTLSQLRASNDGGAWKEAV